MCVVGLGEYSFYEVVLYELNVRYIMFVIRRGFVKFRLLKLFDRSLIFVVFDEFRMINLLRTYFLWMLLFKNV